MIEVKSMKSGRKQFNVHIMWSKILHFFLCPFKVSSLAPADSSHTSVNTKGYFREMVGNLSFTFSKNCCKCFPQNFSTKFLSFFLKINRQFFPLKQSKTGTCQCPPHTSKHSLSVSFYFFIPQVRGKICMSV